MIDPSPKPRAGHGRRALSAWWILVLAGLACPTLVTWIYFDRMSRFAPAVQQAAYAIGKTIQFLIPLLAWRLGLLGDLRKSSTQSEPALVSDNEPAPAAVLVWPSLAWGAISGLLIAGAILATFHWLLVPSGWMEGPAEAAKQKIQSVGLSTLASYVAVAVFYSLAHSALEEYYWRWFVFRLLTARLALLSAVAASSAGFMAHHILVLARYFGWTSPLTYAFSLGVAAGGVIWALLYYRYRTLSGPWISHALVDAAIFAIGYEIAFAS